MKPWNRYIGELFDVLGLPKGELLGRAISIKACFCQMCK